MKIMKSQLKRIIKEELAFLREEEEVAPEAIEWPKLVRKLNLLLLPMI